MNLPQKVRLNVPSEGWNKQKPFILKCLCVQEQLTPDPSSERKKKICWWGRGESLCKIMICSYFQMSHWEGSFGIWKGFSCGILALFCFVKFRKLFVTKLNISSLLHHVPNPQGLLRDSCGFSKRKLALAGKQKEPKGSKNAQLEVCFYSDCIFFPFSFSSQTTPCCLEITVVQFSLGMAVSWGEGRWERQRLEKNSRVAKFPTVQSVYQWLFVLYWLTCIFPIWKWL